MALGRRFNNAIRGEFEFAFRSNTADQWSVNGAAGDWSGHVFGYSGMANVYHDFAGFSRAGITPYAGVGIGLVVVDGDFVNSVTAFDIDDTAFAYQFIAGGSKSLSNDVDIFGEYRFFGTTNLDITNTGVVPAANLGEHNVEIDNIFFGIRVRR